MKKTIRELFLFALVGLAATLLHYGIAIFFSKYFHLLISNLMAYLSALSLSYFGHSLLTFRVKLNKKSSYRFFITSLTSFLLSEIMIVILSPHIPDKKILMIPVIGIIPIYTFLMSKFWVFKAQK